MYVFLICFVCVWFVGCCFRVCVMYMRVWFVVFCVVRMFCGVLICCCCYYVLCMRWFFLCLCVLCWCVLFVCFCWLLIYVWVIYAHLICCVFDCVWYICLYTLCVVSVFDIWFVLCCAVVIYLLPLLYVVVDDIYI